MSLSKHQPQREDRNPSLPGQATSDDRFLALMRESADIFWILTPEGLMQDVSPVWCTFTGQKECECLGRGWLNALRPDDRPQVEETLQKLGNSSRSIEMQCQLRRYDGLYRLLRLRAIPVHNPFGRFHEVVICGNDLTRLAQNRQMSEAQMRLIMNISGVGTWDWDCLTNQLIWTDQQKTLFGWSADTPVTHERFLAALHPDDRERVEQAIVCMLTKQQECQTDYRVIWPDKSVHWLSERACSVAGIGGKVEHVAGITVDITSLKQAVEQSTTVLESITDSFSHVDRQWRYTYANRGLEKMMGKKREEIVGRCLWDLLPNLLGTPFERVYREAMVTQQTTHIEGFHPDFRTWLDISAYPTPDGLSFYLHDITERKQAEEALRESEARFRALMDANLIGITISDLEGTIQEANEAFCSLIGYTQADLTTGQLQWQAITPPEYQVQHVQALEELVTTGRVKPFEKEFVAKNGTRVPVLVGRTLFRREGSQPLVIGFVLDQTSRKEIERQKDLFLGMTSHELKTPLTALKATLQLLQRRLQRLEARVGHLPPEVTNFFTDLSRRLATSDRQVDMQARLINDLLDVSRMTTNTLKLDLQPCDLVLVVREAVEDLRMIEPERSLVLTLPEQTTVEVLADADRISQVVTNYVTNALRYSPPNQPVHIGLTVWEESARVWVRDAGPGLSQEAQRGVWQRYHQVKGIPVQSGSGKGLGLGLYICQTLITQHQGEVGVESTPGKGSTFWFTLPILT